MLLDEKVRFAGTVFGVGFAAALILIKVGIFFGLLENAMLTIDRLSADLWVTARNTPNVDFSVSRLTFSAFGRSRGVARADNLIVWYAIVALPTRRVSDLRSAHDFFHTAFSANGESGDPADSAGVVTSCRRFRGGSGPFSRRLPPNSRVDV